MSNKVIDNYIDCHICGIAINVIDDVNDLDDEGYIICEPCAEEECDDT